MAIAQPAASWRGRRVSAVLFDLDGTLLDTVGDIALALNRAMDEYGWPALPEDEVRTMIGRGSPVLMTRAAAASQHELDDAGQAAMLERFFHHYGLLEESGEFAARPYPGAAEALRGIHERGLPTAVVTNKQHHFAHGLLDKLNLLPWVDLVIGGDTCERRKPDPQPLLHACTVLRADASDALMVGDSINDVKAARAGGLRVICVPYGYNEGNDPRSLQCDAMVESLAELPGMLWPAG